MAFNDPAIHNVVAIKEIEVVDLDRGPYAVTVTFKQAHGEEGQLEIYFDDKALGITFATALHALERA